MAGEYRGCAGKTAAGGSCKARAMDGSRYCYGHAPERALERRETAIKAGRSGGRGRPRAKSREVAEVKQGIREVIQGVHAGKIDKGSAAVMFQGFNAMLRAVELEHAARKEEERLRRLEEIEEKYEKEMEELEGRLRGRPPDPMQEADVMPLEDLRRSAEAARSLGFDDEADYCERVIREREQ